ncbi:MAG: DUF2460 domain-containing protein [Hydrogenophaga sp.]|nr:DUF2460 domain-containing protein [Hydrogenophaga sp.]
MTFIDHRLSEDVSAGFRGGPEWSTAEVALKSGVSDHFQRWSMPRHRYQADYLELVEAGLGEGIVNAFMAARGRLHSFRFRDHRDHKADNVLIGTGAGTSAPMQLVKLYTFGPATYARKIVLPIASTVTVTQNGSPKAVTVNASTGMVTPTSAWANSAEIRWSGEFDVEVRFGSDYYPFSMPIMRVTECAIDLVERKRP